ncbi:DNase I-like protein [Exidia glandulosa HHB12029]|uniref:DNase I-like protein n=1 Tax=Exidia glandulosa HHB12029 TaxID=1314781 RepID=A0A165KWT3_EXIGL|nr:DNase I-like protein [Exidia glandulosa HHB12029]
MRVTVHRPCHARYTVHPEANNRTSSQIQDVNEYRQGDLASRTGVVRDQSATRTCNDGTEGLGGGHQTASSPTPSASEAQEWDSGSPTSPALDAQGRESPHDDHRASPANAPPLPLNTELNTPEPQTRERTPTQIGTQYRPYPSLPRTSPANTRRTQASKKRTLAHLLVSSENMRGRGHPTIAGSTKWAKLVNAIRTEKIGIMAIQETHLLPRHLQEIEQIYTDLLVINSADPDNPSGAGGVAIVMNKKHTNTHEVETRELIPGRAIMATFNWHRDDELTVLAIYAPNGARENAQIWADIKTKIRDARGQIPKPDIFLGDMNFVEDNIDRLPVALHGIDAPDSFDELKHYLALKDGWRETNPGTTDFTWRDASRTSMSRIDRIYLTDGLLKSSRNWKIQLSNLNKDDHSRISVEIVNMDMPEIGPGRWTMRELLIHDKDFMTYADAAGKLARDRLDAIERNGRSETENAQTVHRDFKQSITREAKRRMREVNCKRRTIIATMEQQCKSAKAMLRTDPTDENRKALKDAEHKRTRKHGTGPNRKRYPKRG